VSQVRAGGLVRLREARQLGARWSPRLQALPVPARAFPDRAPVPGPQAQGL